MHDFADDHAAFYYGYTAGINYEAYNPAIFDFSDIGRENYRLGYAKAMRICQERENGIAPLENRSEDYQQNYSYYSQQP